MVKKATKIKIKEKNFGVKNIASFFNEKLNILYINKDCKLPHKCQLYITDLRLDTAGQGQ
jgi:hypothetical protein